MKRAKIIIIIILTKYEHPYNWITLQCLLSIFHIILSLHFVESAHVLVMLLRLCENNEY